MARELYQSSNNDASIFYFPVNLGLLRLKTLIYTPKERGSIIFVVGKSPMDIMEPILCRKKVPY
ncbi:hypothetical protein J5E54_06360, partial [Streptococcus pneumoniae]|nr:hypothetical protein [Streptococcus pneumoniae]